MDLGVLSGKKGNLKRRAEILNLTRRFFIERGYLEVETPSLAPCPIPEAFIEPITSECGCLLPSPELYMKPLLSAGYGDIFQICHAFRRGEKGARHREEFTLLEYYRIGRTYLDLAIETESLIINLAECLIGSAKIQYQGKEIDLTPPWPRVTVSDSFMSTCGWDPVNVHDDEKFDFELATRVAAMSNERPLILYDFPSRMASLARLKPSDSKLAERTEIFIGGLELANIFSELTDPEEQRRRFENELDVARSRRKDAKMPEDFLESLAKLPEAAGGALGMDRLVMLLCDAGTIDEVTAFPV
ncbi:lysyl-tRNA synthetase, class 2 [Dehalogenimonas formicexedens]|uniref:Lysyl-tRNA synthetase, class 2 n=1 Tax=Dehalogenimonas formicexedens TaxID=1839801 RepID=A0A1P8F7V1_9CHLR|nr:amino acid--tRNA ligase-related protein [Dehalogenimonas formicexedens]APV44530.1 lysyl-tRNA synthetase, class 2 [Dehalogenimonas formicexedens]